MPQRTHFIAFRYFLLIIFCAVLPILLLLEFYFLERSEKNSLLSSKNWEIENSLINRNNIAKIIKHPQHLWQSKGHKVIEKSKGRKRILVVADSMVWGDGYVNMNDIWWRQLDRYLKEKGHLETEVIAAGMNGVPTRLQIDWIAPLVKKYDPDLLIWNYVTNDPDEKVVKQINYVEYHACLEQLDSVYKFLRGINIKFKWFFPKLLFILSNSRFNKLEAVYPINNEIFGYPYANWELELLKGENFAKYKETLKRVSQELNILKIPSFFMTIPNWPSMAYFEPRYRPIKPLMYKYGIKFFDILQDFTKAYPDYEKTSLQWSINPVNGHPGKTSTYFYAKMAYNIIRENFPHVLTQKQTLVDTKVEVNDWHPISMPLLVENESIVFEYPQKHDTLLTIPQKYPHIRLHFTNPVDIKEIFIEGNGIKNVRLVCGAFDPIKDVETEFPERKGSKLTWKVNINKVNYIKLNIVFNTDDRIIKVNVEK